MAISANGIRTTIGIIGLRASTFPQSDMPTFTQIYKLKSTEGFSGVPYVATMLNCLIWVLYGLPFVHPNSVPVLSINTIGAALELSYLFIFFVYATKHERTKVLKLLALVLTFYFTLMAATLSLAESHSKRTRIVGATAVVITTLMYASPLTVMVMVIRTKSVKYLPFYLILMCFINGVIWTAYAVIKFDIFITIPNAIGCALAFCQLAIYAVYRNSSTEAEGIKEVAMHSQEGVGANHANMTEIRPQEKGPAKELQRSLFLPSNLV